MLNSFFGIICIDSNLFYVDGCQMQIKIEVDKAESKLLSRFYRFSNSFHKSSLSSTIHLSSSSYHDENAACFNTTWQTLLFIKVHMYYFSITLFMPVPCRNRGKINTFTALVLVYVHASPAPLAIAGEINSSLNLRFPLLSWTSTAGIWVWNLNNLRCWFTETHFLSLLTSALQISAMSVQKLWQVLLRVLAQVCANRMHNRKKSMD